MIIVYFFSSPSLSFSIPVDRIMGLLLRTFIKTPRQQHTAQWMIRRAYSSDITASAVVYSEYGQPSQVLK